MKNAFTVDVEEWFQLAIFKDMIKYDEWDTCESRVVPNICKILSFLSKADVKATFFVLGWVAERHPEVVKAIKELGHEIASHGYAHRLIYEQTKEEFIADVKKSIDVLEEITGERISGYRAPSFSIVEQTLWAWEALAEIGIRYTSSVYPIKYNRYGITTVPRFPFRIKINQNDEIIEFPLSTVQIFGKNIPVAGGGFLRLYPYWFVKRAIKQINAAGKPVIIFLSSWELDQNLPKRRVGLIDNLRYYGNLSLIREKMEALLEDFEFTSVREILEQDRSYSLWPEIGDNNKPFNS